MVLHVRQYYLSIGIFIAWLSYMITNNKWYVFTYGWPISVTMVGGAFISGATPLGGGAIIYPVMVLVMKIVSNEARTFALMDQSVGMSSAAFSILMQHRDTLSFQALLAMILCGTLGFNIGYYLINLPGSYVQAVYFSFTLIVAMFVQLYINFTMKMSSRNTLDNVKAQDIMLFIPVTVTGGIISALTGTGADILMYMYYRLIHNTEETITTNHSILVMASIALFGFYNELVIQNNIPEKLWDFWLCLIPVVIISTPAGNYVTNRWLKRKWLNTAIYVLQVAQYIAGFVITLSKDINTIIISVSMIAGGIGMLATRYVVWDKGKHTQHVQALQVLA